MIRTQLKWVAIGQAANLLLPVLLFPLLAQRLGVQGFAVFAVLTGLSQYSTLVVELGLNHVGLARMNNAATQAGKVQTFSSVQAVKLLLALGVLLVLAGVVAWRSPVRQWNRLVLPAPLGPIMVWMVPASTLRLTPLTAWNAP